MSRRIFDTCSCRGRFGCDYTAGCQRTIRCRVRVLGIVWRYCAYHYRRTGLHR